MTDARKCRKQADQCLHAARFLNDEHLRVLFHNLARAWIALACQYERENVLRDDLAAYSAERHQTSMDGISYS
jgi:hypothetical protein